MWASHGGRIAVTAGLLAATLVAQASPSSAAQASAASPIRFGVTATTEWGDELLAVGSVPALGSWDPARAVHLDAHGYPVWSGEAVVPADVPVEYKYVVRESDGTFTWEEGPNRLLRPRPDSPVTVRDTFRRTPGTPASGVAPTCITWSETWRYTSAFNGCGTTYHLQVLHQDGTSTGCREVAAATAATFAGYGPYENHAVAVLHC
ncbi:carbohydrate-binding module family 20 domain-containing protein [Streptomyces bambusae]|nr:carbohydrate-binding module family 20 domain-containing protein [Streptomyces bambusae]